MATTILVESDDPLITDGEIRVIELQNDWRVIADGNYHICHTTTYRNGTTVLTIKATSGEECGHHG